MFLSVVQIYVATIPPLHIIWLGDSSIVVVQSSKVWPSEFGQVNESFRQYGKLREGTSLASRKPKQDFHYGNNSQCQKYHQDVTINQLKPFHSHVNI